MAAEKALAHSRQLFVIPSQSSPRAGVWLAAYDALTLPVLAWGPVQQFRATAAGSDVSITCVGLRRRFLDLLEGLFGDVEHVGTGPPRRAWRRDRLSRITSDVILVEVHRRFVAGFQRGGWLIVPESVRWRQELAGLPSGRPSKSLRSDMAKLKKHGYVREEADSDSDWREFFDRMLLPHARKRFEDRAQLPNRYTLRQLRNRGRLLFVRRGDVRVAGGCVLPAAECALFERLGVRDGDEGLLREGALSALYLLTFEWAAAEGYRDFDAGTTLPFPDDGLAVFKAKFGLAPAQDPLAFSTGFVLQPESALTSVLRRRPIFHLVDDHIEVCAGEVPFEAPSSGESPE